MSISELPQGTVTLLKSGQVISTVSGAVKELIENSLDAGATSIEIRLEDFGFSKLEVKDNGKGVEKTQVPVMVLPHTTSKIRNFEDLLLVDSYGFRGEALAALCTVSKLKIRTKVKSDLVASTFTFATDYSVQNIDSQAGQQGTTVTACDLFHNLPVRRNYYKDHSRKKEEIRKVERLVQSFSIINPTVRFSLHHNKVNTFGKIPCDNISKSSVAILGHGSKAGMCEFCFTLNPATGEWSENSVVSCTEPPEDQILVYMMIPKKGPGMAVEYGRSNLDRTFIFVNKRPVDLKAVEKMLKKVFSEAAGLEVEKFPFAVISVIVGRKERPNLDANLEPNKQKINLGCMGLLVDAMETFIRDKYFPAPEEEEAKLDVAPSNETAVEDDDTDKVSNLAAVSDFELRISTQDENEIMSEKFNESLEKDQINRVEESPAENNDSSIDEIKKSCFTMIGQTQPIVEKEEPQVYSQFFARPKQENPKENDDVNQQESRSLLQETESLGMEDYIERKNDEPDEVEMERKKRSRSPVLKADMFVDPDLPGVDAVYLSRLRDGDFTDVAAEIDIDDADLVDKPFRANSFINFESEDTDDKENFNEEQILKSASKSYDDNVPIDRNTWATGRLMNKNGGIIEPTKLAGANGDTYESTAKDAEITTCTECDETSNFGNVSRYGQEFGLVSEGGSLKLAQAPVTPVNSKPKELSRKRKLDETTPKIDMFIEKAAKKTKEICLKTKTKRVEVSFDVGKIDTSAQHDEDVPERVIGSIEEQSGNIWMYSCNEEIHALFPLRIKERMIFDRLMTSFPIPFTKLPEPILVHPGPLNPIQSSTLLSMYTNTRQCPSRLTDRRLTFNGFDLVVYDTGRDQVTVKLEGRSTDIAYYGLADLQEMLDLVATCNEDSVAKCRPTRARNYLMAQARRMMNETGANFTKSELKDLLIYKNSQGISECPHQKALSACLKEIRT